MKIISLDPAKLHDYAAIAVGDVKGPDRMDLVFLERHQGISYPALVDRVKGIIEKISERDDRAGPIKVKKHAPFILDATGLGMVLRDDFAKLGIKPLPVMFTAGDKTTMGKGCIRLGKLELIGVLLNSLEFKKIKVNPALPNADILFREAANYRGRLTTTGYMKMEAMEGEHDDLLIAVALLAWFAFGGKPRAINPLLGQVLNTTKA
jgi:hypothetical protein